jgi:hypothetical protein
MMNNPVRLFMLAQSEGSTNRDNLISVFRKCYFDWSTLYKTGDIVPEDVPFDNVIDTSKILQEDSEMRAILTKNFENIHTLRGFQKEAINDLVSNKKNIFVQNYTGSGKSLLFQLYAMFHPGLTVVISPFVAITLGIIFISFLTPRPDPEIPL